MEDAAIFFRWTRINSTRTLPIVKRTACLLTLCLTLVARNAGAILAPDHIVVVIMENKAYSQIIGSPRAPYINDVLVAKGALLTRSFGVRYPSQPNYLELFSGSNQGVTDDNRPLNTPFNTPNLGAKLIAAGFSFATYSQSLPHIGFKGQGYTNEPGVDKYKRKHNPALNWQELDAPANNHLPPTTNLPFRNFPTTAAGYDALPTVSFVVPNEQNNMHDGSIAEGDAWLRKHLEGYRSWAMTHNSVLLLTFDEDDRDHANHIPTVFVGQPIIPGRYSEKSIEDTPGSGVNHWNILRTIEHRYGLGFCNAATDGSRKPITDIFYDVETGGFSAIGNVSSRGTVRGSRDAMITSFMIGGHESTRTLIRGLGPSLRGSAAEMRQVLADPILQFFDGDGNPVASNDDWSESQPGEVEATGFAPAEAGESAILTFARARPIYVCS